MKTPFLLESDPVEAREEALHGPGSWDRLMRLIGTIIHHKEIRYHLWAAEQIETIAFQEMERYDQLLMKVREMHRAIALGHPVAMQLLPAEKQAQYLEEQFGV